MEVVQGYVVLGTFVAFLGVVLVLVQRLAESFREQSAMGTEVLRAEMAGRFDGVDRRLDGVQHRLETVETRLDGVETGLDGVETRLVRVESQLDGLDRDVQVLTRRVFPTE